MANEPLRLPQDIEHVVLCYGEACVRADRVRHLRGGREHTEALAAQDVAIERLAELVAQHVTTKPTKPHEKCPSSCMSVSGSPNDDHCLLTGGDCKYLNHQPT